MRKRQGWFPVAVFLGVATVLFLVVWQTNVRAGPGPEGQGGPPVQGSNDVLEAWLQYDAGWYISIVEDGYFFTPGQQSSVAFFPAYPIVVEGVAAGVDNARHAAILTTFLCGLAVAWLFWRWCADRMAPAAARTAVLLLLVYPYAWYLYGSGYGDALFLVAALGAFLLLERDRPVLAGLAGAVATATRPNGLAVLVALVALVLDRRGVLTRHGGPVEGREPVLPRLRRREIGAGPAIWESIGQERQRWRSDRSRLRLADGGVLLAAGGIAAYSTYLWVRFSDPVAFLTVQAAPGWNQGAGPMTWFKRNFFALLVNEDLDYGARLAAQAVLTVAVLILVPFVVRRFGWAYGLYVAVAIGIPAVGSSTFQGLGRYCLAAFPCFALAGEWLADRPRVRAPVLVGSATALVVLTALFARGYYLS